MFRFSSYRLITLMVFTVSLSFVATSSVSAETFRAVGQGATTDDAQQSAHDQMDKILLALAWDGMYWDHTIIREYALTPTIYVIDFEVDMGDGADDDDAFGGSDGPNGGGSGSGSGS